MNIDRDFGQRSKLSKEENKLRAAKRTEANRELQHHQLSGLCPDYDQDYTGSWFFDYYQPHRFDADGDEKDVEHVDQYEVYFLCFFFCFCFFVFFCFSISNIHY